MIKLFKRKKIINISILVVVLLTIFSSNIFAIDSTMQGAENFINIGNEDILNLIQVKNVSDTIYNVFLAIGTAVVVIVGAVLGIQFIMGAAEEKAKVQEALIPYIVGSIVIFGAFGIWKLVVAVFKGM